MSIYEPSRGGTRGGQDQFEWENVKIDKYRENYLGHSLKAPVGRWQKGRDLTWYTKESKVSGKKDALKAELAAIKKAEEEAMARALGLKTASQKSSGNLTKQEMMQVCKRRTEDDVEVTGREKLKGVGFDSQRNAMMGGPSTASKDGMTTFEGDQSTTEEGRLVFRRTSESERRLSSISSDQPLPPLTPTELTTKQYTTDIMKTKEKKIKKKHKKEKNKKKKKTKERHISKRHKHDITSDTPSDSSSTEDKRERRHYYKRSHSYHQSVSDSKRRRHDSDSD